jgi:deoxycytidine triphosphate deaminase
MILGDAKILKLVGEKNLVEDFNPECLGGAGYDLRLNKAYRLISDSLIGVKDRKTPDVEEIKDSPIKLRPGEYVLVETLERVNMPENVMARILPRSSLFRCGCMLATAVVDPGYRGALTMGLKNVSDRKFTLERKARIAQIVFEEVEGSSRRYEGKYQGGKVV